MKYKHFEDAPVWKAGVDLTVNVFEITQERTFRGRGDIANQVQRAALSIPNNIAEGFERGTTAELLQFLYYAKGSAGEVRSICHVLERMAAFAHLKSEISNLKLSSRNISRQLAGWAYSLQESGIKGTRHLTEQSRNLHHQRERAQAFMADMRKQHEERLEQLKRERDLQ